MAQTITRIQLLLNQDTVPVSGIQGYLDVAEEVKVPITYAVSDIRDISKRAGTFSKTIILPGTKNNHELLGQIFDINLVQETFKINVLQPCHLLQNNIPVIQNAYMQLVRINKQQAGINEDEQVTYEVIVKDDVSDFFTKLGSQELTDLDFSNWDHNITSSAITSTFGNTAGSGYKYIGPWVATPTTAGAPWYTLNDWKPAIYAKQYWDQIHARAGFSYQWTGSTGPFVRFDKLIIPYNGDDIKISQASNDSASVKASRPTTQICQPPANVANIAFNQPLLVNTEQQDPFNQYNPATSRYTVAAPMSAPNAIDFTFTVNFRFQINNPLAQTIRQQQPAKFRPEIQLFNVATGAILTTIPLAPYSTTYPVGGNPAAVVPQQLTPGLNTVVPNTTTTVTGTITNVNTGTQIGMRVAVGIDPASGQSVATYGLLPNGFTPVTVRPIITVSSVSLKIALNTQSIVFGGPVLMNNYIPAKIKQSEFIKSICMMYNLYVEPDPNNSRNLIYRTRDAYYDAGQVVDWTQKLDRSMQQIVSFIPELGKKRLILSYKPDTDLFNTIYTEGTNEVYGQQEIIFENEYIKDTETQELVFSPTPVRPVGFGPVAPLIGGQNPQTNIRILLDNGSVTTTQNYTIQNYVGNVATVNTFPFVSHMSAKDNPQFDINFGVCEYYFYDIVNYTQANLYNLFWQRTMAQRNSGKLLTAWFWLTAADIQKMRLNDKIRIDNSYWNINKIIDYDANSSVLTKVELMSIDDNLRLPVFNSLSSFQPNWYSTVNSAPQTTVSPVRMPNVQLASTNQSTVRSALASSVIETDGAVQIMGRRAIIGPDFTGIVIGDDQTANQPGIYVPGWSLTADGLQRNEQSIIDAGLDSNLPRDKRAAVDIIDAGIDRVLDYGNQTMADGHKTIIDSGEWNP